MKPVIFILALLIGLMLCGCIQVAKGCIDDCSKVCSLVKAGDLNSNYTSITMEKKTDGATFSCTCSCQGN